MEVELATCVSVHFYLHFYLHVATQIHMSLLATVMHSGSLIVFSSVHVSIHSLRNNCIFGEGAVALSDALKSMTDLQELEYVYL